MKLMDFLTDASGAVTVDWAVMSAGIVGLALASVAAVSTGVVSQGSNVESSLCEADVSGAPANSSRCSGVSSQGSEQPGAVVENADDQSDAQPEDTVENIDAQPDDTSPAISRGAAVVRIRGNSAEALRLVEERRANQTVPGERGRPPF